MQTAYAANAGRHALKRLCRPADSTAASAVACQLCVSSGRSRQQRRLYASAPLPSPLRHPDQSSTIRNDGPLYTPSVPSTSSQGFGQPLPSTHPHLLKHGELTEGIPASEYETRRRTLLDSLPDGSIVVLAGGRLQYASQGIFYKFRQVSDFFYLTGWLEQDAAVILEKTPSARRGYVMTFFCRSRDAEQELWEGPRNGPNGAVDLFGADQAMDIALFTSHLRKVLTERKTQGPIYVDVPDSPTGSIRAPRGTKSAKSIVNFLTGSSGSARKTALDLGLSQKKTDFDTVVAMLNGTGGSVTRSLREEIDKIRILKSQNEVRLMRKAADISGDAHAKVMRLAEPGVSEHVLVTTFEYECALSGSQRPAYVPVCASGANSRFLHYISNNALLEKDSLVLIDAGCEYAGYASDITRTFPVRGHFTQPERELYQAVLNTVKACTKMCSQSEGITLYDLHDKSRAVLQQELKQLGIDCTYNEPLFGRIYPHFVGHPLGLDLHDCPTFQRNAVLLAGNVVTIEPGVYMPDEPAIPAAYRGLAIRLEEEVLVGEEDPIVLSVNAPIEIADVEACCQGLLQS